MNDIASASEDRNPRDERSLGDELKRTAIKAATAATVFVLVSTVAGPVIGAIAVAAVGGSDGASG